MVVSIGVWLIVGSGCEARSNFVTPPPREHALVMADAPPPHESRGVLPCGGADIDADGELDFIDVILFLQLFSAGSPLADFDANGAHDYLDVLAYLQIFGAGC